MKEKEDKPIEDDDPFAVVETTLDQYIQYYKKNIQTTYKPVNSFWQKISFTAGLAVFFKVVVTFCLLFILSFPRPY